jgi:hypothetical protein
MPAAVGITPLEIIRTMKRKWTELLICLLTMIAFCQANEHVTGGLISTKLVLFPEAPGSVTQIGVGDTNGDGKNELVAVNSARHQVRIFTVGIDYSLSLTQEITLPVDNNMLAPSWAYISVYIVDINCDGANDIMFWHRANNRKGKLIILQQTPSGSFEYFSYLTGETDGGYNMAIGDVNGDGLIDVITANHGYSASAGIFVLYNSLDSNRFMSSSAHVGPTTWMVNVYAADIDNDGKTDVLASTHAFGSPGIVIFPNIGTTLSGGYLLAGPKISETIGIQDLNGDGHPDLVVTDSRPWGHENTIQVYLREGSTFAPPMEYISGPSSKSPRFFDFDRDGRLDIVLHSTLDRTINFFLQDPSTPGKFLSPIVFHSTELSSIDNGYGGVLDGMSLSDINNDGTPEVMYSLFETVVIGVRDGMAPSVSLESMIPSPVAIGTQVILRARADDTSAGNSTISAISFKIDDGEFAELTADDGEFDSPLEAGNAVIGPFSTPGIREVCVQAVDSAGNRSAAVCSFLPVYDPDGGFVTGGGSVLSPAGADLTSPNATGPARFGFVSKYKRGASTPDGNVQFRFEAGGLRFTSTSMEWLVVTGEPRATFRGVGSVEGQGSYPSEQVHS